MAEAKLVLWGEQNFYSPYVFSCWVALKEKGVTEKDVLRDFETFKRRRRR